MFALVRFVHEEDNRLHIVPVDDIEKFNPGDDADFDNRLLYSVMWRDDLNEENTGTYSGQILMLDPQKPDFSYMGDGFFHLKDGFCVSGAQAAKIFGNKKGTLVCKDTAQALWGSAILATRSVSGNIAPKKRALGELPKQQLTPKKVDVVVATIQHWGKEKNVDVSDTMKNLSRLLTEKIQDVSKALRKLDK
ncbi:hypothetical protein HPB49_003756 [Dermacentor silvarum]|uniref:Uncharacterized protein n=1 Tax=Dermacentor silvarum TaxID=543639 RepID=A0ACB8DUA0_DERSI|nr:hypothetical protein HPB49_003756 [Dermacentor silvarum]